MKKHLRVLSTLLVLILFVFCAVGFAGCGKKKVDIPPPLVVGPGPSPGSEYPNDPGAVTPPAPGAVTLTDLPHAASLVYNGQNQTLLTAGAASGGVMKYSLDKETWSEALPEGKDAGEYVVWYKVFGDDGHVDSRAGRITCFIEKAAYDISGLKFADAEYAYDGTEKTLTATGIPEGVTATYENNVLTNAGSIAATAKFAVDANHESIPSMTAVLTITGGQASVTTAPAAVSGLVYNGQNQALITAGAASCGTVKYSLDKETWIESLPEGKDAGEYGVWYKVFGNAGYADTRAVKLTCRIEKAVYDISDLKFEDAAYPYDGEEKSLTASGIPEGVTAIYENNTLTNAGSITATAKFAVDGNHEPIPSLTAVLTITGQKKKTYDMSGVVFADAKHTYDGTPKTLTITDETKLPATVTVSYTANTLTAVGNVSVTATFAGAADHEPIAPMTAVLTIEKRTLGISWKNLSFTYDGTEKIPSATLDGVVEGDECVLSVTGGQTNAGTYVATASIGGAAAGNYLMPANGTAGFTIKKKVYNMTGVSFNGVESVYDGNPKTFEISGKLPEGLTVDYSAPNTLVGAGSVTVTATFSGDFENYEKVDPITATFAVLKKDPTAEDTTAPVRKESLVYNGEWQELVTGGVSSVGQILYCIGETPDGEYRPEIPTGLVAGTYKVWFKVKGDANHNDSGPFEEPVTCTIAKASSTVSTLPVAADDVYDESEKSLVTAGEAEGGVLQYALGTVTEPGDFSESIPVATEAGTYYVWYRVAGDGNHEGTVPACVTVTISEQTYVKGLEYELKQNNAEWAVKGKGTVEDTETELIIPGQYKGLPVTEIKSKAFQNWTALASVTISDNVVTVPADTFSGCANIISAKIPAWASAAIVTAAKTKLQSIEITGGTQIPDNAFKGCTALASVKLADTVTTIGQRAFEGCTGLASLDLGHGVVTIGNYSFLNCTSAAFTSLTIPDSVRTIGYQAFSGCSRLTTLDLGNGVTTIGQRAFEGCTGLTELTIPDSVTSIGGGGYYDDRGAFRFCTNLKKITVGKGITKLSTDVFSSCTELREFIILGKDITVANCLGGCPNIETAVIPAAVIGIVVYNSGAALQTVTVTGGTIPENAFKGLKNLKTVTMNEGVRGIGEAAFSGCTALETISVADSVSSIGKDAFLNTVWWNNQPDKTLVYAGKVAYKYKGEMPTGTEISLSEGTVGIADFAFSGQTNLTKAIIPSGVVNIGNNAFDGCSSLTEAAIPNGVLHIGEYAFRKCSALSMIEIPSSVEKIGSYAFRECTGASEAKVSETNTVYHSGTGTGEARVENNCIVETSTGTLIFVCAVSTIPDSVSTIGESAFAGRADLTEITIPAGVTSIAVNAFKDCVNLKKVINQSAVANVDINAFAGCAGIEETEMVANASLVKAVYTAAKANFKIVKITEGTEIPAYIFKGCNGLNNVTIADSVTIIGNSAFQDCTALVSIDIPANVETIGSSAFNGCTALASIDIPASVRMLEGSAFANCPALKTVTFAEGSLLETIGGNAFAKCSALKTVTFTSGSLLETIGFSAFNGCTALASIEIPASVRTLESSAFANCPALKTVTFASGSLLETIGDSAFNTCTTLASIVIPASVRTLGGSAFANCPALTTATFAEGSILETIGGSAFSGCHSLQEIAVPDSVTSIEDRAFQNCKALSSVTFGPDSNLIRIGKYAFGAFMDGETIVTALKTVVVPAKVKTVDSNAFQNCNALEKVEIYDLRAWYDITFAVPSSLDTYFVGTNPLEYAQDLCLYSETSSTFEKITSLIVPADVTAIKPCAFMGCSATELTLPDGLTDIGKFAFYGCGTTAVQIPASVNLIGQMAFGNCNALEAMTVAEGNMKYEGRGNCIIDKDTKTLIAGCKASVIPDDVEKIGPSAFYCCETLSSIAVPASVTSIDVKAFHGCNGLVEVKIADLKAWCGIEFGNEKSNPLAYGANSLFLPAGEGTYSQITDLEIPSGVTAIGQYAFYGCDTLDSLKIPVGISAFGKDAFTGCVNIKTAEMPVNAIAAVPKNSLETVTVIGAGIVPDYAFDNYYGICPNLKNVTLSEGITGIGFRAFRSNYSIKTIVLPDSLNWLDECAFEGVTTVKNATMPAFAIEGYPGSKTWSRFKKNSLTTVHITGGTILANAFENCTALANVTIGDSVEGIGKAAFTGTTWYSDTLLPSFTEENCVIYITAEGGTKKFAIGVKGNLEGDVVLDDATCVIADGAFANQASMSSITIPAGVKRIGSGAFAECTVLGKVVVKDLAAWCAIDFAKAEDNPLNTAHRLYVGEETEETTVLNIPATVSKIGNYAFAGCSFLTKVSIPEGITAEIGIGSFKGCVELAEVSLPSTINKINKDAFNGCGKLETITYAGTVAQWGTVNKASGWNTGVTAISVTCTDGNGAMS